MKYMRTASINGQYAYRASDGDWYVINEGVGTWTGESFSSRGHAVAAMGATA